jgi:hypothetical protein
MNTVRAFGWSAIGAAWALPIGLIVWLNFAVEDAICGKAAQSAMHHLKQFASSVEEYRELNGHYPVVHDIDSLCAAVGVGPSCDRSLGIRNLVYDSNGSEYVLSAAWPSGGRFELRNGQWVRWPECLVHGDAAQSR